MIKKIKVWFQNLKNLCSCPFQPADNPFPQMCDKRIVFTDKCAKCEWRKK